jgi:hypothetical protein
MYTHLNVVQEDDRFIAVSLFGIFYCTCFKLYSDSLGSLQQASLDRKLAFKYSYFAVLVYSLANVLSFKKGFIRAGRMAQVVEHFPIKCGALSSSPRIAPPPKKKGGRGFQ